MSTTAASLACITILLSMLTCTYYSGGLTNKLFRCRLSLSSTDAEPTDILLRIFGELVQSSTEALLNNTVVTALLSERRLGPKLHAVFDGGRIEEFVLVMGL